MLSFSELAKIDWTGKAAYIVGGGPSLRGFDFSRLDGKGIVIGVNKVAFRMPRCDVFFTLDQTFSRHCRSEIVEFIKRGGEAVLAMPPNEAGHKQIEGATYVIRRRNAGLSDDPRDIYGVNSGYGALGLAYQRNPAAIGLLGFDMAYDEEGNTHWHEGYAWHARQNGKFMARWALAFDRAQQQLKAKGIDVVNFTGPTGSKITNFPVSSLNDI